MWVTFRTFVPWPYLFVLAAFRVITPQQASLDLISVVVREGNVSSATGDVWLPRARLFLSGGCLRLSVSGEALRPGMVGRGVSSSCFPFVGFSAAGSVVLSPG